jgi:tetratricopeptide (TPR) repeat protein
VPNHPNPPDRPEAVRAAGRGERWAGALVLTLLVALFHGPSLAGGFVYDDHWTIVENPFIRQPRNLAALLGAGPARADVPDAGRPVMVASEIADHALWGLRPHGYHLQNLVLHLAVAILFFLGLLLAGDFPRALTGAALFAVHPVNVEAIWAINYREDLLCAFFTLAALGAIVSARRRGRGRGLARAAALALTILAGLSKENGCLAPILLVILDLSGDAPDRRSRRLDQLVLAAAAVIPILWRAWVFGAWGIVSRTAEVPPEQRAWATAVPRAAWSFAAGIGQWLCPWRFSPDYAELPRAQLPGGWVAVAAIVLTAAWAFRARQRSGVAIAVLVAIAAYLPTFGLVPISNPRADRYFYLPSLALAAALAWLLWGAAERLAWWRGPAVLGVARPWLVLGGLLMILGVRSRHQGRAWHDDLTLWTHATAVQPQASRAWIALAEARLRRGLLPGARVAVERSLALGEDPHGRELRGIVLLEAGDLSAAHADLEQALAAADPHHRAEWMNNLGYCELRLGRLEQALERFAAARALSPSYVAPWINGARALELQGNTAGARRLLQEQPRAPDQRSDSDYSASGPVEP